MNNDWSDIATGQKVNRRRFITIAGATSASAVLAACGSSSSSSSGSSTSAASTTSAGSGAAANLSGTPSVANGIVTINPIAKTTKSAGELKFRLLSQIAGVPYYEDVENGMKAAASDLGIGSAELTGPPKADVSLQVGIVQTWIQQKVDVIAVSAIDPVALAPTIAQAAAAKITVLTWDVDAPSAKRLVYVNTWDPIKGPEALFKTFMGDVGSKRGEYAFIVPSLTSPVHAGWVAVMKAYQAQNYPTMKWVSTQADGADQTIATTVVKQLLSKYPNLVGIVSVDAAGTPAAASVIQQMNLVGKVTSVGLSTPSQMKQYLDSGAVKHAALWDVPDLGQLITRIAFELVNGRPVKGGETFQLTSTKRAIPINSVSIPKYKINPGDSNAYQAIEGPVQIYTKANVGQYHF